MSAKIVKKRHKIYKFILSPILKLFLRSKCGYRFKKVKTDKNKNYVIISNHVGTFDPIYLDLSFKFPVYMLATDDIFNKGFISKMINHIAAPIPKKKGMVDITAVKTTLRVINEGGSVGIFVEGNRTFNGRLCTISPSIVKLIRKTNLPLICFNFIGGYGADPRWGLKTRFGKVTGEMKRIIEPNEYSEMNDTELYNTIIQELSVDDFSLPYRYKSLKKAEKLERIFYICPKCKNVSTLVSKKNEIKCIECGLNVKYNEDLSFSSEDKDFHFKYIPEWYQFQIDEIKKYDISGKEKEIYQDHSVILLEVIDNKKNIIIENGVLIMTNKSLIFMNDKKKVEFLLSEIVSMASLMKTKVSLYTIDKTFRFNAGSAFNGLKYVQAFYHIKNKLTGENDEYFGI